MIVILWSCVIGYGITVKVNKFKYKICYYFMGNSLIFQFLYINVLNYRYFHTVSSTFLKNIKRSKNKKTQIFLEKKTFINVYYNYEMLIVVIWSCSSDTTHRIKQLTRSCSCCSQTCLSSCFSSSSYFCSNGISSSRLARSK